MFDIKKSILASAIALGFVTSAKADYRIIIPQQPIQPWIETIAPEWSKKLGETIVIDYQPGAMSVPGVVKFDKTDRFDNKVILQFLNGSAEALLTQGNADFDISHWAPLGLNHVTNTVGYNKTIDPYKEKIRMPYSPSPATNADAIGVVLQICGPDKTFEQYLECYKERMKYVTSMQTNEANLAYQKGELNVNANGNAGYRQQLLPMEINTTWYTSNQMDLKTGKDSEKSVETFPVYNDVYKAKWGKLPNNDLWEGYELLRNYRDVLQKSLWVNKDNPNRQKLIDSLKATLNDPDVRKKIEEKIGPFPWIYGDDVYKAIDRLHEQTTERALKTVVRWNHEAFGFDTVFKAELVKK